MSDRYDVDIYVNPDPTGIRTVRTDLKSLDRSADTTRKGFGNLASAINAAGEQMKRTGGRAKDTSFQVERSGRALRNHTRAATAAAKTTQTIATTAALTALGVPGAAGGGRGLPPRIPPYGGGAYGPRPPFQSPPPPPGMSLVPYQGGPNWQRGKGGSGAFGGGVPPFVFSGGGIPGQDPTKAAQSMSKAMRNQASNMKKATAAMTGYGAAVGGAVSNMNKFAAIAATLGISFSAIGNITQSVEQYKTWEAGLIGVAKTTDLSPEEMKSLGEKVRAQGRTLPVNSDEMLAMSQYAGQVGVRGVDTLIHTATTGLRMQASSDLSGEAGIFILKKVKDFSNEAMETVHVTGSTLVALGNEMAATEAQIANVGLETGKVTGRFGFSSSENLALAAGFKVSGVEKDVAGTSSSKILERMNAAVRGNSKRMDAFTKQMNISEEEFKNIWFGDPAELLVRFMESLEEDPRAVEEVLKSLGMGSDRMKKAWGGVASNASTFRQALTTARQEEANPTALLEESERKFSSFGEQLKITANIIAEARSKFGEELAPALLKVNRALGEFNATIIDNGTIMKRGQQLASLFETALENTNRILTAIGTYIGGKMIKHFAIFMTQVETSEGVVKGFRAVVLRLNQALKLMGKLMIFGAAVEAIHRVGQAWRDEKDAIATGLVSKLDVGLIATEDMVNDTIHTGRKIGLALSAVFSATWSTIKETGMDVFTSLRDWLIETFSTIGSKIGEFLSGAFDDAIQAARNLALDVQNFTSIAMRVGAASHLVAPGTDPSELAIGLHRRDDPGGFLARNPTTGKQELVPFDPSLFNREMLDGDESVLSFFRRHNQPYIPDALTYPTLGEQKEGVTLHEINGKRGWLMNDRNQWPKVEGFTGYTPQIPVEPKFRMASPTGEAPTTITRPGEFQYYTEQEIQSMTGAPALTQNPYDTQQTTELTVSTAFKRASDTFGKELAEELTAAFKDIDGTTPQYVTFATGARTRLQAAHDAIPTAGDSTTKRSNLDILTEHYEKNREEFDITAQTEKKFDHIKFLQKELAAGFRDLFVNDLPSAVAHTFTAIVDGTMSAKDAFKSLARMIVTTLIQTLIEVTIRAMIIKAVFGSWMMPGDTSNVPTTTTGSQKEGGLVQPKGIIYLANGGQTTTAQGLALGNNRPLQGPGGTKQDQIHAMLSPGEFVINAQATKQYLPVLQQINNPNTTPHTVAQATQSLTMDKTPYQSNKAHTPAYYDDTRYTTPIMTMAKGGHTTQNTPLTMPNTGGSAKNSAYYAGAMTQPHPAPSAEINPIALVKAIAQKNPIQAQNQANSPEIKLELIDQRPASAPAINLENGGEFSQSEVTTIKLIVREEQQRGMNNGEWDGQLRQRYGLRRQPRKR